MLNLVTPIQETKAYQSIYAEGKAESLKRLLTRRFGPLPAGQSSGSTPRRSRNWTPGSTASSMPPASMI
ncbi:hypothetical protein [Thiocapsa sp.]|uniref:hypothetical protein n=1 Tax=Thiocapsa sp. TaxID=2024551 RepID=UPI00260B553C|nr:hypothetical protein [Thiocapsa sp.]